MPLTPRRERARSTVDHRPGGGIRHASALRLGAAVVLAGAAVLAASAAARGQAEEAITAARLSGADRYATAAAVATATSEGAEVAVLASGERFPDALAASFAAGAVDGPVLLTGRTALPPATLQALRALGPARVVVVGGLAAVGEEVEAALAAEGLATERVAGTDRFETAAAVALRFAADRGAGDLEGQRTALLASGEAFPDALAAGALAAGAGLPMVLTPTAQPRGSVGAALEDLAVERIVVVGGPAAVSADVVEHYEAAGYEVERWAGATRTETAAAVAGNAVERLPGFAGDAVLLARGDDFPDALAASALGGATGAPILLTATPQVLAPATRGWLLDACPGIGAVRAVGGTAAVDAAVLAEAVAAAGGCQGGRPPIDEVRVALATVAEGFAEPIAIAAPPEDGRLFVLERAGRIWVLDGGRRGLFLDLGDRVRVRSEEGLLGMAFHPDHGANGRFFVHHTDLEGATNLAEYRISADPDVADPRSRRELLRLPQPAGNHNGGMVAFGPDGMLHLALGDGGGQADAFGHGQRPDTPYGAILRVDVDGRQPYAIPPDNPFADGEGGAPEVWHFGLRNPWRFSFDGDLLYLPDVGESRFEEVNVVPAQRGGLNFGWSVMEGGRCFDPPTGCPTAGLTMPVLDYGIGDDAACAVIGGAVYRGRSIPGLRGHYVYTDLCAGFVRSFRHLDGQAVERRDWTAQTGSLDRPYAIGRDAAGELYVAEAGSGRILQLVPAP